MSALRRIFADYRSGGGLADFAVGFLGCDFFLIASNEEEVTPLLSKSPKEGEWCVTVSDSESVLVATGQRVVKLSARDLLGSVRDRCGVLVVAQKGGDYLQANEVGILKAALKL